MGNVEYAREFKGLKRRDFLKAAAAATAALGIAGCAPQDEGSQMPDTGVVKDPVVIEEEGEWIPGACWHNCGGSCMNKVLVKDGVIIRQKTDDTGDDTWEKPQQRGCVRGRSTRKLIYSADRLKYPMKRKGWSPDSPNGEMRGKDEWERISWDEAYEYIGDQINRIVGEVGPSGIVCLGNATYGAGNNWKVVQSVAGQMPTLVAMVGSPGTWNMNMPAYGLPVFDMGPYMMSVLSANDRFDMLNADTIIINGGNPAWASAGNRMLNLMKPKEHGAEYIYVGPSYNFTASALGAKWIQVRPGTDIPLLLSVAYEMLRIDEEEGGLIDWDFLKKYTIGFTMDTLPKNASVQECFMDYVQGKYDGVPKTPEWASFICGTDPADIEYYARALTKQKNVMYLHSYPAGRCDGAEDLPQLFLTLGLMGGHVGKPGNATGAVYHCHAGDCGPQVNSVAVAAGYGSGASYTYDGEIIMSSNLWDAILEGKYWYFGNGIPNNFWEDPVEHQVDIRMLWHEGNQGLQTLRNTNKGIQAYRKLDFVVSQNISLTGDCLYADIVLPVCTPWETWSPRFSCGKQSSAFPRKIIDRLYEAKTDTEICRELMNHMGLPGDEVFPPTPEEIAWISTLANLQTTLPDGSKKNIVSIPTEKFEEFGLPDMEATDGMISWDEMMEQGIYTAEPGDGNYSYIAYQAFIADPENNPLPSASGKFEIYCEWKSTYLNKSPYLGEVTFKPYPSYTSKGYGWEKTFSDFENQIKGEYPFVVYQPHYLRRSHTTFDNVSWLRETWENPVFLNAADAAEKGIKDGDTVLIYNQHGQVIRHATLLETIMPGCVALPHGTWFDLDEETGIDRAGADNMLIGSDASASNSDGYNNVPVNYRKYDDEVLEPDCLWEPRTVDFD